MIILLSGGFFQRIFARATYNRYREVFDRAGYAIMLIDNATNRFIKVNRAAAELFGYSEEELQRMTPLDLSTDTGEQENILGSRSEEPLIRPARRKDGRIITIKVQTSYLERFNVSLISDVTEEYRIRRALELNEERLREAQRIGRFGWWEFRPETNMYIGSEEISRIFTDDPTSRSFTYQDNISYTHPEDRSYLITSLEDAIEKRKESFYITYRIITPQGKVKAIAVNSNIRYDDNGRILYRYGTCQDITETQRIMDDLIAARRQAEESDRLKTTFLANFSHEIRTPLNAMMGFLNILTSMDTTEAEKQEMVQLIEVNSQRLLRLINDMIDMSRIESNSMEIKYTNVEINGFIKSMVSSFDHELETEGKKELKLTPVIEKSKTSVYQYIDELRLSQIFSNLVSNAIKFTDDGEIKFGYRISRTENRYTITYFVTDTGAGIRPERLDDIFLPFVQYWNEDVPKVQGAGLGLAICKRLTELMKGRIWVESLPGRGSSFLFSFNTPVMIE
ncbi:MAG: PAS domain S-box protein [Bacteroidales bacterium]|nr:PAS domain S-box protein [Bacteroidales bacterium]